MKFIRGLHNIKKNQQHCVATIGNYDGMHLGHQAIINRLKQTADNLELSSMVVLFEPQPLEFLLGDKASARLTTLRNKLELLAELNIDYVVCIKFNAKLANMPAEIFAEHILKKQLKIQSMVIGDDFTFGKNREGGFELLQRYFPTERMTSFIQDKVRVSSTMVRQALAAADFKLAQHFLGRPYSISGKVGHGNKLGNKLGFPTANIHLQRMVLPFTGVYKVKIKGLDANIYTGVANIGKRPTINGTKNLLEIHILNFKQNIYGKRIEVEFLHKIRDEIKFDSLELLKQQIQQDVNRAK